MPAKPSRFCGKCRKKHSGDCPKNTWQEKKRLEVVSSGRGGRPWQRLRQEVFERDNYLCQEHYRNGKLMAVELHGAKHGVCDHVVAKAEGGTDDLCNLQTLCQACSDVKTAEEAGRGRQKFRD